MADLRCDVAVIGAGTAGLGARSAAAAAGASTLIIDPGPLGTTCARVGCMPSKLLIAAADAAVAARGASTFGIRLSGPVEVDGPAVMRRVRSLRDDFVGSVLDEVAKIPDGELISARARFLAPDRLALDDGREVVARAIVIATGSRNAVPEPLQSLGDLLLTNDTVFELDALPRQLAVVGAGPLGIELALAFARLGVDVTVFDRGKNVGGLTDPDVDGAAQAIFARDLTLRLDVQLSGRRTDAGAELSWEGPGGAGSSTFDRVLIAAGRPPNLAGLDLETTGLELDEHGVPEFDRRTMRCGSSAIFLAGDDDADAPILHEATAEGRIAGRNAALLPDVTPADRNVPFALTFSEPGIAIVGGGWKSLGAEEPAVGTVDLTGSGRARAMDRADGLLRLYGHRADGRVLGMEMVGPEAEHLGHLVAWAVQRGLSAAEMMALPFYHPTLEESLKSAVRDLCRQVKTNPKLRPEELEAGVNA